MFFSTRIGIGEPQQYLHTIIDTGSAMLAGKAASVKILPMLLFCRPRSSDAFVPCSALRSCPTQADRCAHQSSEIISQMSNKTTLITFPPTPYPGLLQPKPLQCASLMLVQCQQPAFGSGRRTSLTSVRMSQIGEFDYQAVRLGGAVENTAGLADLRTPAVAAF